MSELNDTARYGQVVATHQGYEIHCDSAGIFRVDLGDDGGVSWAERIADVKERIDKVAKAAERRGKKKLALPVLAVRHDKVGHINITGVHASRGTLLGTSDYPYGDFYVDVPWIEEAVAARAELLRQAGAINDVLRQYELSTYHNSVDLLEELYAAMELKARQEGSYEVALEAYEKEHGQS